MKRRSPLPFPLLQSRDQDSMIEYYTLKAISPLHKEFSNPEVRFSLNLSQIGFRVLRASHKEIGSWLAYLMQYLSLRQNCNQEHLLPLDSQLSTIAKC